MTIETLGAEIDRWANGLITSRQIAEVVADTEFVSRSMRGKPDVVTAAIMYGLEVGVSPMQALQGIHIVEGRPQPSAELMRALILAAGHTIAVHPDMSGVRVRVSGLRSGRPEAERLTVEWNMDMARAAGLASKQNWRAYPRAMLLARATSDLARLLFPDVIKGLGYMAEDQATAEALAAMADTDEDTAPVRPAVPRRKRRPSLPSPGHTLATEDRPGPDGSVDVPLVDGPTPVTAPPREPASGPPDNDPPAPALPDLAPETTPDEPTPGPKPLGEAPFKALQAGLARTLGRVPREDRLGALEAIVGRPIASSRDLTRDEGYRVLGFLERVNVGAAGLVKRAGVWEAVAYGAPPEVPGDPSDPWAEPEPFPEIGPPDAPGRSGRDRN